MWTRLPVRYVYAAESDKVFLIPLAIIGARERSAEKGSLLGTQPKKNRRLIVKNRGVTAEG